MGRLPDPLTGASGRAVFVPYALPGERVRLRLVDEKRGYAHAELLEVLAPSAQRITPRCKHYFSALARSSGEEPGPALSHALSAVEMEAEVVRACGGCHYQHMPYESQLRAKEAILRDQLARVGHIQDPPVSPIVPSPSEWNYRNHVQFHLTVEGKLGFISPLPAPCGGASRGERQGVRAITECHLPEPSLNSLWPGLEFEPDCGLERVSLRLGADEDVMLILESEDQQPPEIEVEAGISVVHLTKEDSVVLAGDDHIIIKILDRPFRVSAGSFFQVNTPIAGKMVKHLLIDFPISPTTTLLDIYCGVGLFSAFLAPHVKRLIGVEISPSACEDFAFNLDEFDNVELYEGAAEEILPALVGQIGNLSYALVDPPRAGLGRCALDAILALYPSTLAYVSCDPSTLARDASRLIAGGYRLKQVTPFDLFPQTYHIESISIFEIE